MVKWGRDKLQYSVNDSGFNPFGLFLAGENDGDDESLPDDSDIPNVEEDEDKENEVRLLHDILHDVLPLIKLPLLNARQLQEVETAGIIPYPLIVAAYKTMALNLVHDVPLSRDERVQNNLIENAYESVNRTLNLNRPNYSAKLPAGKKAVELALNRIMNEFASSVSINTRINSSNIMSTDDL